MREHKVKLIFKSPLKNLIVKFIQEKEACGYRYGEERAHLSRFDNFLCSKDLKSIELPRSMVECWTSKRLNERAKTQSNRICLIRQLSIYLNQQGVEAYILAKGIKSIARFDYTPYIFNRCEIKSIFEACDSLNPDCRSPLRHLIMPEVFRLLYGCGMRVNEVLRLKTKHVDIGSGILTVLDGKFKKDRLIPVAVSLIERLRKYAAIADVREPDAFFFPAPDGGPFSRNTIYSNFRKFLQQSGIQHKGRGIGPRLHDVRHSFAVHRLENWYKQGEDLNSKIQVLSTYMGHKNLSGTQRYLRLTPEIFPEITKRMEISVGHIIPRRAK